jgi:ParB family transcriptional regulator, chromosome partitioning protein
MSVEDIRRRHLGRGLSALLGDEGQDYAALDQIRASKTVPVDLLQPNRYQPRHRFNDEDMEALVASVREKGILQPILVRRTADQRYEIVAGERRWRAAQRVGLHDVPVIVKDLSDRDTLEVAIIENIQRQDLSAIEEARGYKRLIDEFQHTQEDMARVVGKSRSHVANMLRLLDLPASVQELVDGGQLSAGHARALIGMSDAESLARQVVARGLNVRQTEQFAQSKKASTGSQRQPRERDSDTAALERQLTNSLGLRVSLAPRGKSGEIKIHYDNLEQLDDVVARLSHAPHH